MFHEILSQLFPCCVAWSCFVSRLCEAVVPRLFERRCLVQIPREALLHKSRSAIKFCDIFSTHCFQFARMVLVCFPLCPVVEVFVHTSHMMSHRTWFRGLDLSLLLRVSLTLRIKKHVCSCLISAISSEHHKCHSADRYFHSGSVAARSAASFCWSLCETHPLTAERNFEHH